MRVWDLTREGADRLAYQFEGHTEPVWKCVFSRDGKLALSGGHDGRANVYDIEAEKLITSVDHGDIVINAEFSPDGRRFATTGLAGRVRLWDTRTGALLANLDTAKGKDARFADNEHLVAARGDGRIQIFKLEPSSQFDGVPPTALIGARGTKLVFDDGFKVDVRDVVTKRVTSFAAELSPPFAIAADATLVAGRVGGNMRVVDTETGAQREFTPSGAIYRIDLSANGVRAAVFFENAAPEIWDTTTGKRLLTLQGATAVELSEDGKRALSWSKVLDAKANAVQSQPIVWDVDAQRAGVTLPVAVPFSVVGFARMGTRIAIREEAADLDKVTLWNIETGAVVASRPDMGSRTTFDPTRRWLTTIERDSLVTVWSTDDGAVVRRFFGEKLLEAQVNPNATFVAAIADYGKVALLMRAIDGRILARWPIEHPEPKISSTGFIPPTNGSVTWTHDGGTVITRSRNVAAWPVANGMTSKKMLAVVNRNVPWQIVNGNPELISNGILRGTVLRDDVPVENVELTVEIRTPPDIGATTISWETSNKRVTTRTTRTNALGEFKLDGLLPGEFTLTVENQTFTAYVSAEDEPHIIELSKP